MAFPNMCKENGFLSFEYSAELQTYIPSGGIPVRRLHDVGASAPLDRQTSHLKTTVTDLPTIIIASKSSLLGAPPLKQSYLYNVEYHYFWVVRRGRSVPLMATCSSIPVDCLARKRRCSNRLLRLHFIAII